LRCGADSTWDEAALNVENEVAVGDHVWVLLLFSGRGGCYLTKVKPRARF
jgi:hypothetical protein